MVEEAKESTIPSTTTSSSSITDTAIIIRGGGFHGSVVLEHLQQLKKSTSTANAADYFVWDDNHDGLHSSFAPIEKLHFGSQEGTALSQYVTRTLGKYKTIEVYIAVGSGTVRQKLVESVHEVLNQDHFHVIFPTLIHPTAVVSPTAAFGQGCFVGPFAFVNAHCIVGDFSLVNTCAILEHDCKIGDYVTMNPRSTLLGSVSVASFSTIGSHATVRNGCCIDVPDTTVGMGATVVKSIYPPAIRGFWAGVPAKPVISNKYEQASSLSSSSGVQAQDFLSHAPMRWCFKKPFSSQRVWKYLQHSVESGHVTNDGPLQSIVAAKMQAFVRSVNCALMASNGTAALHALCAGLSLKAKKDLKWVTQAFTFPSSIQGPLMDSLIADMDPEWYGPCRKFLEAHKNEFDGVVVTNVFGHQTDLIMYEKWCKSNGKFLVLDNAASPIGFVKDSRCIHDVGDGAIVSLHETKPIGRGEGGVIFAKREILPFVHQAMNFGFDIPKQVREPHRACSNWRMSDIAAAAVCDHLDFMLNNKWEDKLQELTKFAVSELEKQSISMALPVKYPTILSCLFIKLNDPTEAERILHLLHSHNIEAKHYYEPLCSEEEAPEAWKLFSSSVCLPFHLGFSESQLKAVIDLIASSR